MRDWEWNVAAAVLLLSAPLRAQQETVPPHLRDRDAGIPTSMFGTYVHRGEVLFFPFFSYTLDKNQEYQPVQLGYAGIDDYRGRFWSSAGEFFMAYGLTDRLAVEVEGGFLRASLDKSPQDTSAMPLRITESGFADLEGQLRYRLADERGRRPEIFGFLEVTAPLQHTKVLIGEPIWDFKAGIGLVRGLSWGTLTSRITVEYNHDDTHWDLGEFSIEYLKRLSPAARVFLAFEGGESGAMDEWTLITGIQWRIADFASLKLDQAVGISSKATDWAPQVGIIVSLPRR